MKREGKEKSRGCGVLSTMLSKTTVNKILDGICCIMQKKIVEEIGEQQFSVLMDGSQDTSVIDQETIIIRYVKAEQVKERLFAIRKIVDASGSGLHQLLKSALEANGLKMSKIVRESFDGAANMRGVYNGVQKFIKEEAPNSVYIWCYAHVLNLSPTDIVENILEVKNLIGVLQATVTFFLRILQTNECVDRYCHGK